MNFSKVVMPKPYISRSKMTERQRRQADVKDFIDTFHFYLNEMNWEEDQLYMMSTSEFHAFVQELLASDEDRLELEERVIRYVSERKMSYAEALLCFQHIHFKRA